MGRRRLDFGEGVELEREGVGVGSEGLRDGFGIGRVEA